MTSDVTQMLVKLADGDTGAMERLLPMVYDELRRIARNHLRRTNRGATLDTTGLVHEAYLKLAGQKGMRVEDRGHFLAIAACARRRWRYLRIVSSSPSRRGKSRSAYQREFQSFTIPSRNP